MWLISVLKMCGKIKSQTSPLKRTVSFVDPCIYIAAWLQYYIQTFVLFFQAQSQFEAASGHGGLTALSMSTCSYVQEFHRKQLNAALLAHLRAQYPLSLESLQCTSPFRLQVFLQGSHLDRTQQGKCCSERHRTKSSHSMNSLRGWKKHSNYVFKKLHNTGKRKVVDIEPQTAKPEEAVMTVNCFQRN